MHFGVSLENLVFGKRKRTWNSPWKKKKKKKKKFFENMQSCDGQARHAVSLEHVHFAQSVSGYARKHFFFVVTRFTHDTVYVEIIAIGQNSKNGAWFLCGRNTKYTRPPFWRTGQIVSEYTSYTYTTNPFQIIYARVSEQEWKKNVPSVMCAQRRLRSACASAQTALCLRWSLKEALEPRRTNSGSWFFFPF